MKEPKPASVPSSLLTEDDIYLWNEGTHTRLYEKLGAHPTTDGSHFAVWAPNADQVSVVGDWNSWDPQSDPLKRRGSSGIWEGFAPAAQDGHYYKYWIRNGSYEVSKADPFGFRHESPPANASQIWNLDYQWSDKKWMARRERANSIHSPISVYELHLGSWKRHSDGNHLTYTELADELPGYLVDLGFTHVELLPVMEHPFYGSWGYQTTGYFAPTNRYGTPQEFMGLVDALHAAGIAVILDWVPSHFPSDEHGLAFFDGTHLYEHADPRQGLHPDWKTYVYNYGRSEVPAFLISSALFWLDKYHIDGLRVDAVASMLYLDYSRDEGQWIPNEFGGKENLEAVEFLRKLNTVVYGEFPSVQVMAEESTAWPMVSRPTFLGGLGFGFKWDMGWMHDTLRFLARDPVHRSYHHNELTFRAMYSFSENFIMPLSHDEVVHGKGSLLNKMPGDEWQKFANLRLLYAMLFAEPGKKLLFMGSELAQHAEWDHETQLDWESAEAAPNSGISRLIGDLNDLYSSTAALHELDCDPSGFEWVEPNDPESGIVAFLRTSSAQEMVLIVYNTTPTPQNAYRVGVPKAGRWTEVLNTDSESYGGSGQGNLGGVATVTPSEPRRDFPESLQLTVPPLGAVFLSYEDESVSEEE